MNMSRKNFACCCWEKRVRSHSLNFFFVKSHQLKLYHNLFTAINRHRSEGNMANEFESTNLCDGEIRCEKEKDGEIWRRGNRVRQTRLKSHALLEII